MLLKTLLTFCAVLVSVSGDCDIVSKKDWGGLRPSHVEYLPRPLSLVIIQHTVTPTCDTDAGCIEIVRSIQTTHMEGNGWWDIGASFLVGGNGKVYEGAGWLHVGAHTYGYNSRSIGITLIGNFNEDKPTIEALQAVQNLLSCGVQNGHLTSDYQLLGHRQLISTESPGLYVYNEIRAWSHWLEDKNKIKKN